MKVGFEHMGLIHIPLTALLEEVGLEVVLGPVSNRKTLEIGARHSPEMVCLPFKVTLGNMIQSLENGADTLLFVGSGDWSCRFGYYGRVQCSILRNLGYDFRSIFISREEPGIILKEIVDANGKSILRAVGSAIRGFKAAWLKSKQIEKIESRSRKIRAVEKRDGTTDKIARELLNRVRDVSSVRELKKLNHTIDREFNAIECDKERTPVRVLIVGESYCVIEPLVNFNLIEYLGHSGVVAEPFLTSHRWLFRHALRIDDNKMLKTRKAVKKASKIWSYGTGGEDQVSIGFTLEAKRLGFDGVIHLMPFGCMPETAALAVFESISKTREIPILNISLDEHSGLTGVCTRIEAFIDMLERQQSKPKTNAGGKKSALLRRC
ncbi:Activator of (R)-2-hydroxyglutaryl-CoA dehydratase [Chitinispirillum alkaliphilum]|nr:Activator of (R)-2-hydroxyglutaryl-CoA dehydratase [Chitinispirillum alkaliphilum]